MNNTNIDFLWDDEPIDVTAEANFIWSIANKLRGSYMPDKYGDVIIPMTILRRFECALEKTKDKVLEEYKNNHNYPAKGFQRITGFQFYNTSDFNLKELCNDPDNIVSNFKEYILGFSSNIQDIMKELELNKHIDKMDKDGCLYTVVKAFSELDLHIEKFDSIKMGYIFENLIGRFYQNVDAGQFYTGRDIIKALVSVLISEGCDDIFDDHKVITVCDQACGTGGMLSTAYSYIKHYNPTADVRLFGQEFMGQSYAVGLAEMLIKGQNAENFKHADTFKEDCFKDTKMRFVIENPPFGTPWSGKDAKEGQEKAVKDEFERPNSRWGAGLPSGGDSQLIFLQSAINKLDPKVGRAAIIENVSPLVNGSTASGESQVRKWLLDNDYIEAIIALPSELFYNTPIPTYAWILSVNKRDERKGKIQLIDASSIYHKLRKGAGNKKNELSPKDRKRITELYVNFEENEHCKIFNNNDFIYREYTIMQPLQRSYEITSESIEELVESNVLSFIYDPAKKLDIDESSSKLTEKEKKALNEEKKNKAIYDEVIEKLNNNMSDKIYYDIEEFYELIKKIFPDFDSRAIEKISDGLSKINKKAKIQRDKKGNVIYDKSTKELEYVNINEDIEDYMKREIYPHVSDAKAFFEENLNTKNPTIKTGAEIPFTRYFYNYELPEDSNIIAEKIIELDSSINKRIENIFGGK